VLISCAFIRRESSFVFFQYLEQNPTSLYSSRRDPSRPETLPNLTSPHKYIRAFAWIYTHGTHGRCYRRRHENKQQTLQKSVRLREKPARVSISIILIPRLYERGGWRIIYVGACTYVSIYIYIGRWRSSRILFIPAARRFAYTETLTRAKNRFKLFARFRASFTRSERIADTWENTYRVVVSPRSRLFLPGGIFYFFYFFVKSVSKRNPSNVPKVRTFVLA